MNSLAQFWSKFKPNGPPFYHPEDRAALEEAGIDLSEHAIDFAKYARSRDFGREASKLHLSLWPEPFAGDLDRADIFILMLNPGFEVQNYQEVNISTDLTSAMCRTLAQELSSVEFPNFCFDPDLCWTGAFRWWERKFRQIAKQRLSPNGPHNHYRDALKELSERVASLELFPYKSNSFRHHKLVEALPSSKAVLHFARCELFERAQTEKVTVIMTRQVNRWDLAANFPNVIRYEGAAARGAHVGPDTEGGKAILKHLEETDADARPRHAR